MRATRTPSLQSSVRFHPTALIALLLLVGGVAYALRASSAERGSAPGLGQGGPARVGDAAPDFELPLLEGGSAQLSAERGRVVVLNFWATWCEPCRGEMPALQALGEELRGQPLTLWAIDYQEDAPHVRAFRDELGLRLMLLLDADGTVARKYGARGLPATFVVDRHGVLREAHLGQLLSGDAGTPWTSAWLEARVRELLVS